MRRHLWGAGIGAWLALSGAAAAPPPPDSYAAVRAAWDAEPDPARKLALADRLLSLSQGALQRDAAGTDPARRGAAQAALRLLEKDRPDLDDLRTKRAACDDPRQKSGYTWQIGYTEAAVAETIRLYASWLWEDDPKIKAELGTGLVRAAVESWHHPEIVAEVASDGKFAAGQIPLPAQADASLVPLVPLRDFGGLPSENPETRWVVRRMTSRSFELWSPAHGWLFDARGRVVNEARPPRRDGTGREWYGAFLPDGRWATTDIWAQDNALHFFSPSGKWLRSLPSLKLIPRPPAGSDAYSGVPLIGWCRSDREGKGWVFSVGSEGGWGTARIDPEGRVRSVTAPALLCQPRELEPKGSFFALGVGDDAGRATLTRSEAGHGMWVGFPDYALSSARAGIGVVPEGQAFHYNAAYDGFHTPAFGFWPGSRAVYIAARSLEGKPGDAPFGKPITWFFGADGAFQGWTAATRLADAEDGKAMLFDAGGGRVVALSPGLRPGAARRFAWPGGGAALPEKIFPDLRLGFFWRGEERARTLVLARW